MSGEARPGDSTRRAPLAAGPVVPTGMVGSRLLRGPPTVRPAAPTMLLMGIELTELEPLVRRALAEDVGSGDLTTQATVPAGARARARITQKQPGVLYGLDAAQLAFALLDPEARFLALAEEGVWRSGGPVLDIEGEAAALLGAERTALNLLQRLSGVATPTARCVEAGPGNPPRGPGTPQTAPGAGLPQKGGR